MAPGYLIRSSQRVTAPVSAPAGVVTVPAGCRDQVIPMSDPRAATLVEAGVGLVGLSSLVSGFSWPGPDPLTHLVLVTTAGAGRLWVDGHEYGLVPDTVAVAPAHVPRHHWADTAWEVVSIRIADTVRWRSFHDGAPMVVGGEDSHRFAAPVRGILAELPTVVTAGAEPREGLRPIEDLVARFGTRMNFGRQDDSRRVAGEPFSLYASILRMQLESLRDTTLRTASDTDSALAAVWQAVRHDPAGDWSVAQLAARLHVSRPTLHRLVARVHRSTPAAIVERIRMDEAARLLAHGDLPIKAIATRVGYASPYSFSTAFRRTYDRSPSTFRAEVASLATRSAPRRDQRRR